MTKEEIREVMMQISNDTDNLEIAMSELDMELIEGHNEKYNGRYTKQNKT